MTQTITQTINSTGIIKSVNVALKRKELRLSDNALTVLETRYLKKNEKGEVIETPEDLFWRVAYAVAQAEKEFRLDGKVFYEQTALAFYNMLVSLDFLPNSPCLMNAGTENQQCSACFVLGIQDSMESIFDAVKNAALIHKSGGGTGFGFSNLRPANDVVRTTSGISSGPVSFMHVFNAATEVVKQGSRRRGANLACLSCTNPDIRQFITCKSDTSKLTNFNISVAITDEFMEAVKNNTEYDLINPRTNKPVKKENARDILNLIAKNAHATGEPGMIFIDEINRDNQLAHIEKIESCNPCWLGHTRVWTVDGPKTFKELAERKEKIRVLSENHTNFPVYEWMYNVRQTGTVDMIVEITLENGAVLECTPEHKLYKWLQERPDFHTLKITIPDEVEAKDLRVGDELYGLRCAAGFVSKMAKGKTFKSFDEGYVVGRQLRRKNFRIKIIRTYKGEFPVYNGAVEKYHRYYVYTTDRDVVLSANCGEIPAMNEESCCLGSINLSNMVENGAINWDKLARTTHLATRFLDNIITINDYPLDIIKNKTLKTRKIGLGVMGFADMLIKLKILYDTENAEHIAEQVMGHIDRESRLESIHLAKERGEYPMCRKANEIDPIRNMTRTTIAPTGSISLIANCSSGIEPIFAAEFDKNVLDGKHLKNKYDYEPELLRTAHEVSPEWHVRIQAAFQKHVGSAISKTINCNKNTSIQQINDIFLMAYDKKLKGITVYRDGSRENQVLTHKTVRGDNVQETGSAVTITDAREENGSTNTPTLDTVSCKPCVNPRKRPSVTNGITEKVKTGCGNLYVTMNEDSEGLCEIFCTMGRSGGCASSQSEAVSRLISLCLRSGINVKDVIKQLKGIRCPSPIWHEGKVILSCADAIANALLKYVNGNGIEKVELKADIVGMCPDCGNVLQWTEGCVICKTCGYSKC